MISDFSLRPCVTRSTRLEKAWTGQTCSYSGAHAAHNSQLISLQAKQHSESAGQRALIEANQEPQSKVRPGSLLLGADINRHLRSHSISRFHQGLHERLSSLSFTALRPTSLEESRRCQRACPRPVQMFPTGNSASEKATKRPRDSIAYSLARSLAKARQAGTWINRYQRLARVQAGGNLCCEAQVAPRGP